jgi:branched-chain amino acid transport system ATP-binding protein
MNPGTGTLLSVSSAHIAYGKVEAVRSVSLDVADNEIVTIIGANGAGKTTLLQTIAGLLRAQAGEILFDKEEVGRHAPEAIAFLGCALVPEGRQVFAPMTVHENLQLGAYVQIRRGRAREVESDLGRVFDLFPRLKERASQLAGTLSGGEQQMLAIGRALMARPKLIMMDEPSMGLAPLVVKDIFAIIRRLGSEGHTVLLVEQNAKAALRIANRGYVLENGRILLEENAEDLLANRDVQRAYLGRDLDSETELDGMRR